MFVYSVFKTFSVVDDGDDVNGIPNSPSEDALTADGSSDGAGLELGTENVETVTNSRLVSLQVVLLPFL